MFDVLKNIPLFGNLSKEDLDQLCGLMDRVTLPAGEDLFAEGDPGDRAYVLLTGEVEILKVSGNRNVLLAVRTTGEIIGELALLENKPRMATIRARTDCEFLVLSQEQLDRLLSSSPSAAKAMYYTILRRWRGTESKLQQATKMAQLGQLTAGVAHELNNPAAAVRRGAEQLETAMNEQNQALVNLTDMGLTESQWQYAKSLSDRAQELATRPPEMDALARSDREYELEEWLEDLGVDDAWELAPTMVDLQLAGDDLKELKERFSAVELSGLFHWLIGTYTVHNLFAELKQGAERISGIVRALKTYSYLDQAPVQAVDLNKGLDDTLLILKHKLGSKISVRREYDPDLPLIQGYGSELNQVWTNIIDNAADALSEVEKENKSIVLRTRQNGEYTIVEIEDNGPGIPPDVQKRLFEPFFTTKPPGVGTGLGLDISYNIVINKHRGDIRVDSEPGRTLFQVLLPLDFENCDVAPPKSTKRRLD